MNKEVRPFEEYKEIIQDMNKDNMIRGLYDMSKHIIELENKIDKAIEYIKKHQDKRTYYTPEQRWEITKYFVEGYYELLEILGDKE